MEQIALIWLIFVLVRKNILAEFAEFPRGRHSDNWGRQRETSTKTSSKEGINVKKVLFKLLNATRKEK